MAPGDAPRARGDLPKLRGSAATDPIVRAIALAETGTTGEIRVHLTKRLIERNPHNRALWLFDRFGMTRTRQRNAVLLYVNLRRRRFAILGDQAIDQAVTQIYWRQLANQLTEDLRSTDPERAIAMAVESIGEKLKWHFPEET
jgi:uncharacterized membrane protein